MPIASGHRFCATHLYLYQVTLRPHASALQLVVPLAGNEGNDARQRLLQGLARSAQVLQKLLLGGGEGERGYVSLQERAFDFECSPVIVVT